MSQPNNDDQNFSPPLGTNADDLAFEKRNDGEIKEQISNFEELKKVNQELIQARKAALQLIEDAILSKEALRVSEEKYRTLFDAMNEGYCIIQMIYDNNGKAINWRFLQVNHAFEVNNGLHHAAGKTIIELSPDIESKWIDIYDKVAQTGEPLRFEEDSVALNRVFSLYAFRIGEKEERKIAVIFADISLQKKAEKTLRESEEKKSFLLMLSDALRPIADPVETQEIVTRLAMNYFKADRCYYCEIENNIAFISRDAAEDKFPSISGMSSELHSLPILKAVIDAGKPFVIQNVHDSDKIDDSLKKQYTDLQIISFLGVPVINDRKPVSILCITQSTPRQWTESEIQLAEEVAERTWAAVEKAKAEDANRANKEHKEFLLRLNDTIRQLNDPVEIQYEAARLIGEQLAADRVHFAEITADDKLVIRRDYVRGNAPSIAGTFTAKVLATAVELDRDEPVVITDIPNSPLLTDEEKAVLAAAKIRSQLSVALSKKGKKVASFSVDQTTPREWKPIEISILQDAAVLTLAAVEKAKTEEILKEREAQYALLVNNLPDVVFRLDKDLRHTHISSVIETVTGISSSAWIGKTGREMGFPVDSCDMFEEKCSITLSSGTETQMEFEYNGHYYRSRIIAEKNALGISVSILGITENITKSKKGEQALRKSEEYNALLLRLSDKVQSLNDPLEIQNAAMQMLSQQLKIKQAYYFHIEQDNDEWVHVIENIDPSNPNVSNLLKKTHVLRVGSKLFKDFDKEKVLEISNIDKMGLSKKQLGIFQEIGIVAFLNVPLFKNGTYPYGISVHNIWPRKWMPDEISLIREIGARTSEAVERAKAKNALNHNERLFSALVNEAPFGVYMIDANFRLRQYNTGSVEVFKGIEPLIGRDFAEILRILWAEPFATEAIDRFHYTLKTGESFISSPIVEQRANIDEIQSYDWQLHRLVLPEGNYGVVCYFYDLSHQKRLEETVRRSEERLHMAVDAGNIGTCDWNYITKEMQWNDVRFRLYGMKPQHRLINVDEFYAIIHPDDVEEVRKKITSGVEGNGFHAEEYRVIHPDGTTHWIYESGRVVERKDGKPFRVISVLFDITDRKKMEQQKEDFISIASHELKTPVTSIKAYAELLQDMWDDGDYAKGAPMVKKLNTQVDRLIDLIHTLLDVTKMTQGEMPLNYEEFNFTKLVEEQLSEMQRLTNTHHMRIKKNEKIVINADRERVGQVLTNLISNSIKYSPKGGNITIDWQQVDNEVEISVQDEGIGISLDLQEKVFDRFFRVKNVQMQNYPGMGLGLYITANIIRRHGGKIWVKGEPGKGSVFYFTLPLLAKV